MKLRICLRFFSLYEFDHSVVQVRKTKVKSRYLKLKEGHKNMTKSYFDAIYYVIFKKCWFRQMLVAFSEHMNFTWIHLALPTLVMLPNLKFKNWTDFTAEYLRYRVSLWSWALKWFFFILHWTAKPIVPVLYTVGL